ncbi:Fic family protein [Sphingobium sp. TomTYG45]
MPIVLINRAAAEFDRRYAATDWRNFQNFVGEKTVDFREEIHFIRPRPEDVASLMTGWMARTARMLTDNIEPIVAGAVAAFAFIYPFADGNGRIHRFIVQTGFQPGHHDFPGVGCHLPRSTQP